MFNERYRFRLFDVAAFDPASMALVATAGAALSSSAPTIAAGSTLAGGAISAISSIMGGRAAKQAGLAQQQADEFKAEQAGQNAALAIAAGQTKMFDTQQKTNMLESTSTARAGASGVDAGTGSAAENVGDIAKRGTYLASLDLFNGESQATGLLNEAKGFQYSGDIAALEGQEKEEASYLAAGGSAVSSLGSSYKMYKGLS